jgi:hypothetical protein
MNKKLLRILSLLSLTIMVGVGSAVAQSERMTFTGTAIIYGTGASTRTINRTFRLELTGTTSAAEAQTILSTLRDGGQDDLLRDINDTNLGFFSLGGDIGRRVNAVMMEDAGGGKSGGGSKSSGGGSGSRKK